MRFSAFFVLSLFQVLAQMSFFNPDTADLKTFCPIPPNANSREFGMILCPVRPASKRKCGEGILPLFVTAGRMPAARKAGTASPHGFPKKGNKMITPPLILSSQTAILPLSL
jgi:hypothetical protein